MRNYGSWVEEKDLPPSIIYHIEELLKCRISQQLLKQMLNLVCFCEGKTHEKRVRSTDFFSL